MLTQVKAWGNSQAIRIPKDILETLNIHQDDFVSLEIKGDKVIITKEYKHKTLEERAAEFGGKLGPYEEIARQEKIGAEVW